MTSDKEEEGRHKTGTPVQKKNCENFKRRRTKRGLERRAPLHSTERTRMNLTQRGQSGFVDDVK